MVTGLWMVGCGDADKMWVWRWSFLGRSLRDRGRKEVKGVIENTSLQDESRDACALGTVEVVGWDGRRRMLFAEGEERPSGGELAVCPMVM